MNAKLKTRILVPLVISLILISLGQPTFAQETSDGQVAVMLVNETEIRWRPLVEAYDELVLTISGPDGVYYQQAFGAPRTPVFGVARAGQVYPDGAYTYELLVAPVISEEISAEMQAAREAGESVELPVQVQSGAFTILDGRFVVDVIPEPAPDDQLILDDLIVDGSLCVGFDCVNGESFGFDTIRLKENNLRIHFQDTSTSASFPTNDWRLVANDSANGGAEYFAIQDADAGQNVFVVEASAGSNALYVDDYGRVGLGTSTPAVELEVRDSDTPTVRLHQDNSGGWTPQTWDMAGNESNFFIRDVTNGSQLPIRIQPGADSNALTIKSNNRVGLGTWEPVGALEVKPGTDSLFVVLDNGNVGIGTASPEIQLHITSSGDEELRLAHTNAVGNPYISFYQGTTRRSWIQHNDSNNTLFVTSEYGDVAIKAASSAGSNSDAEYVRVKAGGNVGIGTTSPGYKLHVNGSAGKPGGGSWTDSSDARLKENVHPIDGRQALDLLNQLQGVTFKWVNPGEHSAGTRAGLIAQEVEQVFPDWVEEYEPKGSDAALIPEGEKAKAVYFPHDFNAYAIEAIKALDAENQALVETIEEQDAKIADLEARLSALEKAGGVTSSRTFSMPLSGLFLGGLLVLGVVVSQRSLFVERIRGLWMRKRRVQHVAEDQSRF